jgi:cysteine-rich repeat protein
VTTRDETSNMPHHLPLHSALASILLLAACNIDTLWSEFSVIEPTESSTAATSSGDTSSSSSSGDTSTSSTSSTSTGLAADDTDATATETTATTVTTAATSSTDPTPAVCGDGKVDPDEECDDANRVDTDACDNTCATAWTIFVTSEFQYTGNINGLVGADNRCRNRAQLAALPRWQHYSALLSDAETDAADRLHHARGYYRLVNGLTVAHGWDDLISGNLDNPVNVTELSTTANVFVWTGTAPGGAAATGADFCLGWKIESLKNRGHYGRSNEANPAWLLYPSVTNPADCYSIGALYCVEQP